MFMLLILKNFGHRTSVGIALRTVGTVECGVGQATRAN